MAERASYFSTSSQTSALSSPFVTTCAVPLTDSADVALTARALLKETQSLALNDLFISTPLEHRDREHSSQRVSIDT